MPKQSTRKQILKDEKDRIEKFMELIIRGYSRRLDFVTVIRQETNWNISNAQADKYLLLAKQEFTFEGATFDRNTERLKSLRKMQFLFDKTVELKNYDTAVHVLNETNRLLWYKNKTAPVLSFVESLTKFVANCAKDGNAQARDLITELRFVMEELEKDELNGTR